VDKYFKHGLNFFKYKYKLKNKVHLSYSLFLTITHKSMCSYVVHLLPPRCFYFARKCFFIHLFYFYFFSPLHLTSTPVVYEKDVKWNKKRYTNEKWTRIVAVKGLNLQLYFQRNDFIEKSLFWASNIFTFHKIQELFIIQFWHHVKSHTHTHTHTHTHIDHVNKIMLPSLLGLWGHSHCVDVVWKRGRRKTKALDENYYKQHFVFLPFHVRLRQMDSQKFSPHHIEWNYFLLLFGVIFQKMVWAFSRDRLDVGCA
jgi:hypothetical protein